MDYLCNGLCMRMLLFGYSVQLRFWLRRRIYEYMGYDDDATNEIDLIKSI